MIPDVVVVVVVFALQIIIPAYVQFDLGCGIISIVNVHGDCYDIIFNFNLHILPGQKNRQIKTSENGDQSLAPNMKLDFSPLSSLPISPNFPHVTSSVL